MKLTLLLVIVSTMGLSAATTYSQETKLSLNLENVTINELLKVIGDKTDFAFWYNNKVLDNSVKISVKVKNQTVDKILSLALKDQKLSYKIKEKIIFIYKPESVNETAAINSSFQRIKITGTITDAATEDPLIGANILIEGTTTAALTDIDGKYSIEVPKANSVLVFSYLGYNSEKVTVTYQSVIDAKLTASVSQLDELEVVGFGTQKKYSVVGSITSIKPQALQNGTTRSLSNNLAGQLAGIIAVQRSGEPGYDNSSFWIRGISTFAGAGRDPLVLIDGVERNLNDIDPAEIEAFSVLKDASASAVYGVRGANGVILINTKRGRIGKPKVEFRYERTYTAPVKMPKFIGAADYLELFNSIAVDEGNVPAYEQTRIDNTRNKVDPELYADVNWLETVTNKYANNDRANLTVSGGTKMLRYSVVGSFYDELGIIARDNKQEWNSSMNLKRYNVRSNMDLNITPTTLFRVNIGGYLQEDTRPPQSIDNIFQYAFETPPFVHPKQYSTGQIPQIVSRVNPWAYTTQTGYQRNSLSTIQSMYSVEQDMKFFTPGLKAKVLFSFDRYSMATVNRNKNPDYYSPATGRNADGSLQLAIISYGQPNLGYATATNYGNQSIYLEENVTYTKNFGKHYIDAMFLYNQRKYDDGSEVPFLNQGIAGRFSYSYNHKYITEFNFGYNGSENFAPGKRFGFFPSVALGWLLSEEKFMQSLSNTFSKIKFRASYGLVGNDKMDNRRFAYITTIGAPGNHVNGLSGYTYGVDDNTARGGRWEGDSGIPNLTWETVAKTNIGMELGLWNAIELQVDIFKDERSNIFMQRKTIPAFAGFVNTPWANYGKVNNQGIDISLNINKQLTKKFFISAMGTFTYAANKIIEQDEPAQVIGTTRSSTGKPVGQLFGLIADGLYTDADFADITHHVLASTVPICNFKTTLRPGDIKYKDINGDGVVDALDKTAIGGTNDPQIVYGFGVNMRYLNVDLACFFQGNAKTYRMIGGNAFIPGSGSASLGNIYSNVNDRWTADNPRQDVFWPRLTDNVDANNNQASTWWLKDMSMLRLKSVEVGYNLPANLIRKIYMISARFFVKGDNVLTFSKFKLWDPELGSNNGFKYPIMKSVTAGLDINF